VCLGSGCSGGSSGLVPVSGKVTVDGKPLTSGWVSFRPDKTKGNTSAEEPNAEINSQGEYTLRTRGKPGAPPGAYKVVVSSSGAVTPDNTKVAAESKPLVNLTYSNPDTTTLTMTVVDKPEPGHYDLKLGP